MNTLPRHILLVEDTPDIALGLASALRASGLQVTLAADGLHPFLPTLTSELPAQRLLRPGKWRVPACEALDSGHALLNYSKNIS